MKKNILMLLFAAGFSLFHVACDDGLDDYKGEFDTILYFRDSGELPVTLYRTGNNTDYGLIITKAGFEQKDAVVSVDVMNDAQLTAYNALNGVNYKALPSSCYAFEDTEIQMAANDSYKEVTVSLVTEQIEMNLGTDATYVIPFELSEASDSINSQKKYVFIKPSVETVYVGFKNSGFIETENVVNAEGSMEIELPIVLPVANQWDLSCEVEVDETLLEQYNEANSTELGLLSENIYTLEVAPFNQGESSTSVMVHIDKSQLPWGKKALPLRIKSLSNSSFIINEEMSSCIVSVTRSFPRKDLSPITLSLDMLSANSVLDTGTDGTGLAGLIDGRGAGLHFHSNYNNPTIDPVYANYIDFKLPKAINHFAYTLWSRFENTMGAPVKSVIYVGTDGQTWTEVGKSDSSGAFLPTWDEGDMEYNSEVFSSDTPFSYVRMAILESNNGSVLGGAPWNVGEIEIFGK